MIGRWLNVMAAGALVLGISVFDGVRVGPEVVAAREALAIPGTFRSSIVVANPASTAASVSLTFVKSDGSSALTSPVSFTVPAGASVTQFVPNISSLADGRYAVVVDSDQQVVAIANLASSGPDTSTAYNGISQSDVGTSFYIPSVYRAYFGFSSSLVIQNAGTSTANVTIAYKKSGSADVTETKSVPASASVTVDQTATSGLADGFIGSAVVTSDQPVAAIFLISTASGTTGQLSSARGIKSGATSVYLPVVYNQYYGYNTSILVQNVDTASADVKVEYFNSTNGASVGSETATIAAGSSQLFLQFATGGRTPVPSSGFNGAAVVTTTNAKNVVAVANVQHPTAGYLEAYNGFSASSATTTVLCAAILNNYYNYNTSLTIQNVGTAATVLTLQYKNAAGAVVATKTSPSIPAGATHFRYNPNDDLTTGFNGTVLITSSGSKIVATVNELLGAGSEAGDQLFTYNCANT
jgi:hypothetical protein